MLWACSCNSDEDLSALADEMGLATGSESSATGGQSAGAVGLVTEDHLEKGQSIDHATGDQSGCLDKGQSANTAGLAAGIKISGSQSVGHPASDTAIGEKKNKNQSQG